MRSRYFIHLNHFRFNSPYDLFIRISMILNLFSVFCTCDEICKQPNLKNFNKVIFKNDSYQYSHYYHYSQTVSLNQPHPNVSGSFIELKELEIKPRFRLKYFETQVSEFLFYDDGYLYIFKENNAKIGEILNELVNYVSKYLLIEKELMAFKWSSVSIYDRTQTTPIVTTLIYANGKISIYYENILSEINRDKISGILGIFQCETAICPIHNSSEACRKATTSKTTCIWCENWNTCIDSNQQDHHFFKVNGCHFKSPDVSDVSSSTPVNHEETTLGIPEVQVGGNVKETTNGNDQYS
ncbi:unnamed protein product, partial [Schistosoma haematobium]